MFEKKFHGFVVWLASGRFDWRDAGTRLSVISSSAIWKTKRLATISHRISHWINLRVHKSFALGWFHHSSERVTCLHICWTAYWDLVSHSGGCLICTDKQNVQPVLYRYYSQWITYRCNLQYVMVRNITIFWDNIWRLKYLEFYILNTHLKVRYLESVRIRFVFKIFRILYVMAS